MKGESIFVKCALVWDLFSLWFCLRGADAILNGLTLDRIQTLGLSWWLSDKESASNVGDPGLIPGLGRSSGEGNGNPLQYSCWKIPWTEESGWGYSPWGHKESDTTEWLTHTLDSDSNGLKSFIALLFEGQSQGSSSTWALTRDAESQAPLQSHSIRMYILPAPPDDVCTVNFGNQFNKPSTCKKCIQREQCTHCYVWCHCLPFIFPFVFSPPTL